MDNCNSVNDKNKVGKTKAQALTHDATLPLIIAQPCVVLLVTYGRCGCDSHQDPVEAPRSESAPSEGPWHSILETAHLACPCHLSDEV